MLYNLVLKLLPRGSAEEWQGKLQTSGAALTISPQLAVLVGLEGPSGFAFPWLPLWGGCFLETLGSVPSRMLFWTQFSFLISRFQLQHRNRKCIRKRRQPWVQQRNLLLPHPSMRVQPLEPTWSLLVTQGHTTSPVGTLVLTSPAWALRHFSFLSSDTPCLHLPISLHPGVPSSPVLCLPSLVTLFLFLIFQSFM